MVWFKCPVSNWFRGERMLQLCQNGRWNQNSYSRVRRSTCSIRKRWMIGEGSAKTNMPRARSNLSFCRPELAERFPVLLEIGSREVVNFVLLQKGVHLHPRFETKQPAKLSHR